MSISNSHKYPQCIAMRYFIMIFFFKQTDTQLGPDCCVETISVAAHPKIERLNES